MREDYQGCMLLQFNIKFILVSTYEINETQVDYQDKTAQYVSD
jgi:hypothetical protein